MTASAVTLVVLAKSPRAGRVKTRLCPPCTPDQAAQFAAAALRDTLTAVAATPARRRVLALDGPPGPWIPTGFDVVPQCDGDLADRLGYVFATLGANTLLVGMDTPQVTPRLLGAAADHLMAPDTDAVVGPAHDGGYWTIGMRRPDPAAFRGVPMSRDDTLMHQRARLDELGWNTTSLATLRDVDTFADALMIADEAPRTHAARAVRVIERAHQTDGFLTGAQR